MENAELVGLSRQITLRRQLSIVANNLANMNTTGFKSENLLFEEYLQHKGTHNDFERRDRPVSYVQDDRTITNMSVGAMVSTGKETDVALEEGQFFTIQTPAGDRYTRNGAFVVDLDGQLTTSEGSPVLSVDGGPIVFEDLDSNISIARDGTVTTDHGPGGRLAIAELTAPDADRRTSENLFFGGNPQPVANPGVLQGFIEKSNVEGVREVSNIIEITRAYERIAKQIQRQDEIRREAIRTLGRLEA